jgi:branched-chain amino acid transport system ATP-binding protein
MAGSDVSVEGGPELVAENLTVRFQGLSAISGVTVRIRAREVFGLIGPNGAGKTTLVNCLTGFQRPSEGRILLDGQDTKGWLPPQFRKNGVARTFQAGRLFRDMSVLENVQTTGVALGQTMREAKANAHDLLAWVGLADRDDLAASSLAYTDQRRLSIARAMMQAPRFVLLDEPAAGMSDAETEELMALVVGLPQRFSCGVMLIEHNMHMVMNACDRIHVLDGGKSLAEGLPDEIKRHEAVISAYLGMED